MIQSNKILFTGFQKNSPEDENSSFLLIDKISNRYSKFLFSNDYPAIILEIDELFKEKTYDYVILFGQKPLIRSLSIELCGKYEDHVLETNFPIEKLTEVLKKYTIDYKISRKPGTSYCNFLYYHVLKYLKNKHLDTKVLFVHIPFQKNFEDFSFFVEFINRYMERKDIL